VSHEKCNRVTRGPDCSPDASASEAFMRCPNHYKNPPPQECARCHGMYPFLAMGICGDCCKGVAREARRPTAAPTKGEL